MKGEFYISQAIRWNPRLRSRIASLIGLPSVGDEVHLLLAELKGTASLAAVADRLHCDTNTVFSTLKRRLSGEVGLAPQTVGGHLTFQDLPLFRNSAFIRQVSARLGCANVFSAVLERLFNLEELQDLLEGAGIGRSGNGATLEQLFWRLLTPDGVRKISGHLGGIDIWSVLTSFLRDDARERLCASLGCSPEEIFVHLFALSGKTTATAEVSAFKRDETQGLDLFGVEKVKELLRALSNAYLHQGCETADRLGRGGFSVSLRRLFPLLDFYGRQAYRRGLGSFLGDTQALGSLCADVVVRFEQKFEPGWLLRASTDQEERRSHLLVQTIAPSANEWSDLALLYVTSSSEEHHLREHLPTSSDSLGGSGDTFIERLLSCEIPLLWSPWKRAWHLLASLDGAWSEHFVLSGRELPDPFQCREIFQSRRLEAVGVKAHLQTHCPSPAEIADRVAESYGAQDYPVQVV